MCLDGSEEIVKFYTVKSFISASKVGQVYENPWSPDWKRVWSFAVFAFGFATVDFFRVLRKHWDGRYFRGWIGMRLSFPNRSGVEWNARFRERKIFHSANLILELKFWYLVSASILRQAHLGASRDHDFRPRNGPDTKPTLLLTVFLDVYKHVWWTETTCSLGKHLAPWENNLLLGLALFVWVESPTSTHTGSSTNLIMFCVDTAANSAVNA